MSYKTEFQSNNADLQAILDTVNNLPEGGNSLGAYDMIIFGDAGDSGSYVEVNGTRYTSAATVKCSSGDQLRINLAATGYFGLYNGTTNEFEGFGTSSAEYGPLTINGNFFVAIGTYGDEEGVMTIIGHYR